MEEPQKNVLPPAVEEETVIMEHQSAFEILPIELFERILFFVDHKTLVTALHFVCRKWRNILENSVIYKRACYKMLRSHKPDLKSTFTFRKFEVIKNEPEYCRFFLKRLLRLEDSWRNNEPEIHTLNALEFEGEEEPLGPPPDWNSRFMHGGVYDSVCDPAFGIFVCSVYDTIQIWNFSQVDEKFERVSCLDSSTLDRGNGRDYTTCFTYLENLIVSGSRFENVRTYDASTGELYGTWSATRNDSQNRRTLLADVSAGPGNEILTINWYGDMTAWRTTVDKKLENVKRYDPFFRPPFYESCPEEYVQLYDRREPERLIQHDEKNIVTSVGRLIVGFPKVPRKESSPHNGMIIIKTAKVVLALRLVGDRVYWTEQGGRICGADIEQNHQIIDFEKNPLEEVNKEGQEVVSDFDYSGCSVYRNRFKDNITALDVDEAHIVFGDADGTLTILDRKMFDKSGPIAQGPEVLIREFNSRWDSIATIWSLHLDASRIVRGDSDGLIKVYDFFPPHGGD